MPRLKASRSVKKDGPEVRSVISGRGQWWGAPFWQQGHSDGSEELSYLPIELSWHLGAENWDLTKDEEPEREDRGVSQEEL